MKKKKTKDSGDKASVISAHHMESIVDRLLARQHRDSTAKTYLNIWRKFNKFLLYLGVKPKLWEDRVTLFIGYLIDQGYQSNTIKSYVSTIKKTLVVDKYKWDDNLVLVRSLAKACRIINDRVQIRFPIHCNLLELILFGSTATFYIIETMVSGDFI